LDENVSNQRFVGGAGLKARSDTVYRLFAGEISRVGVNSGLSRLCQWFTGKFKV